jgi:hypothetical protein
MWLLLAALAHAGLVLPPGESPEAWASAIAMARVDAGTVRVEVVGERWRLVADGPAGVREAIVAAPTTARAREDVALLAASLLKPGPRVAGASWLPPVPASSPAPAPRPAARPLPPEPRIVAGPPVAEVPPEDPAPPDPVVVGGPAEDETPPPLPATPSPAIRPGLAVAGLAGMHGGLAPRAGVAVDAWLRAGVLRVGARGAAFPFAAVEGTDGTLATWRGHLDVGLAGERGLAPWVAAGPAVSLYTFRAEGTLQRGVAPGLALIGGAGWAVMPALRVGAVVEAGLDLRDVVVLRAGEPLADVGPVWGSVGLAIELGK